MPRIRDEIVDSVFFLYPSVEAAQRGESVGGTGFLVGIPSALDSESWVHIYAVTNSHILREGGSPIIRLNTVQGESKVWRLKGMEEWVHHPYADDVAVCPVPFISPEFKFKCIPRSMFLTREVIDQFLIGPGDDVFLIGRLASYDGRQSNQPSVRFGNISMMPSPIRNSRGLSQESFLIEVRSIGGYSGSPVFVSIPAFSHREGPGNLLPGSLGPWLLGVNWGHLDMYEKVLDRDRRPIADDLSVRSNMGMAGVVPSWKIAEVLDLPELAEARAEFDSKLSCSFVDPNTQKGQD